MLGVSLTASTSPEEGHAGNQQIFGPSGATPPWLLFSGAPLDFWGGPQHLPKRSKNISKEQKIDELKIIAKETVDIKGIGFYTLGPIRKTLSESQKNQYIKLFENYFSIFCCEIFVTKLGLVWKRAKTMA